MLEVRGRGEGEGKYVAAADNHDGFMTDLPGDEERAAALHGGERAVRSGRSWGWWCGSRHCFVWWRGDEVEEGVRADSYRRWLSEVAGGRTRVS